MITLTNDIKKFTHIVHLADIQIRLTKRHDEYREVFEKLFASVANLPETTAICVVGDILHSKLDLSPECVQVTKEFLVGLSDIHPTILVAGNHDTNLTNKNRLDSLSPIVEAINHPNLFYLKKSDLYSLGDICFNNYSIFDDESQYLKGDKIPSVYRNEFRYFICLFHGTVDGAVSEMGFKLVNKNVPISFFDDHDIVLLGDIHKMQILQDLSMLDGYENKPVIHYCGSLIQQNHGEDLQGHGYTFWDLKTRCGQHFDIPNEYGYFTIKIDKGEIRTDLTNIPKKARVRLSCFESLPTETKAAIKEIKKVTTLVEPPTFTREGLSNEELKTSSVANLIKGDLKNRDHQIKLISEFVKNKLKITDEGILNDIIRINDETNSGIKTDDISKNIKWSPIRFEWNNLFSFGEDNIIDFTKMNDVVGLFATNASGKSSVFSAFSWCVFDKCERDFKANNIINDQKMSCRASLEVDIGGVRYFIDRTGKMDKKGAVKVNVKFWRVVDGKEEDLTGIERSDTNNVIRAYIGGYEDFLLTSLSVQKSGKYETSFIDLGDSGRKDLLAQFLGLNIFDILHETANKKLNEIISTLKVYKNEDFEGDLKINSDSLSQTQLALESENKSLIKSNEKVDKLYKDVLEESSKLVKVDGCSFNLEEDIKKSIRLIKESLYQDEMERDTIYRSQNECEKMIKNLGNSIKYLEDNNISTLYNEWQSLVNLRNQLLFNISTKLTGAKILKEKMIKSENYEYDIECKFCVKNADVVTLESNNAEKELKLCKDEISKLLTEQTDLDTKLKLLASVEDDYKRYNNLLKERSKNQEKCLDYQRSVEKVLKTYERNKENLIKVEKELEIFLKNKEIIQNNVKVDSIVSVLNVHLWDARQEQKEKNTLVQNLVGKRSVFSSKIDDLKKKMEKVKEVEKQYKSYDLYVQAVSRDGIPYEVIIAAVPHIENEVNSILSQIVEFHSKFDVDGKNVIPYIVYDERRWLMSLGSGMEQFILSTAIRVALTNLSSLPRSNFLVIDEGFGVLASENLSEMQTLFHFLKTNFDFIIIISHLDALRDMVDSQMEIKKENGFSKVNFV
jgi:DNA repair exonuclease SbcCD ATPase subunit